MWVVLRWLLSPPPPPNWVNVVVYNFPYDVPNHYVSDAFTFFGKVQDVRYQHWTNLPKIPTGTCVVLINLTRSIPCFMKIHSYWCKVWYHGKPVYCDICKSGTHLASSCPCKGKCLSCEGVGHLAQNCPTVCFKCRGGHALGSCPNCCHWEHVPAEEDDFRSVASDLGAGDEVSADPVGSTANSAEVTRASVSGATDAYLDRINIDVYFAQETQVSSERSILSLSACWDGRSFWSPALGHQGGVVVLFSCCFLGDICSWKKDSEGRVVSVLVSFGNLSCNLVNVYVLTNRLERSAFFLSVHQFFFPRSRIIFGGDLNCYGSVLDQFGGNVSLSSDLSSFK